MNAHGFYGYTYLDLCWTEEARHPFFITVAGELAGFVLVSDYCYVVKDAGANSIAEFFVMRRYRRKGVGRTVAFEIFAKFPGKWEVIQCGTNIPSIHFWERVVGEYTEGGFERHDVLTEDWRGQALVFDNSG